MNNIWKYNEGCPCLKCRTYKEMKNRLKMYSVYHYSEFKDGSLYTSEAAALNFLKRYLKAYPYSTPRDSWCLFTFEESKDGEMVYSYSRELKITHEMVVKVEVM